MHTDFPKILDWVNDTIVILDKEGNITHVNKAFADALGFKTSQLIGENIWKLRPLLVDSVIYKTVIEAIERKEVRIVEWKSSYTDRYWESKIFPFDEGVITIGRDITERKESAEKLKNSELRLRSLYENTLDAVLLTIPDGTILSANPAAQRMLGMTEDEIKKAGRAGILVIDDRAVAALKERARVGHAQAELTFRRKDGSTFEGEVSSGVFTDVDGTTKTSMLIRDISERKKMEAKLRESEELYRTLFENSDDGFMLVEPIFDEIGIVCDIRFLNFNPAYERQTGAKTADVLGRKASEVVTDLESEIISLTGKVAKTGRSTHSETYDKYSNKCYDSYYIPFAKGQVGILFRDTTDRNKAEKAQLESEEKYRALVEATNTGYLIWDIGGKIIDANQEYVRLSGHHELREILGRSVIEWTANNEKQKNIDAIKQCLRDGFIKDLVIDYEDKNGLITPVEINAAVIGTGEAPRIVALCRDITERKKAEEAVRLEKERFESLANSLPEIVFESDIKGNLLFANKRGFEITGYSKEDFTKNLNVFNLVASQDKEKVFDDFQKTLNNQPTPYTEYSIIRKDGSTFPAIIAATPIIESGRPIGIRGIVIDITENKKTQEALLQSEIKFRTVADFTHDWEHWVSPDCRLIYVSPSCERITGFKPEEFIEDSDLIIRIVLPDDKALIESHYKSITSKQLPDVDYRIITKNGEVRWIAHTCQPVFDDKGTWIGRRGSNRDITERKQLEKQLRENERMVAIGQTAGMVGHDIRNPLQAVLSDTYLLKEELSAMPECKTNEGIAESLDSIEKNVAYINKIVQDLQDFSRPITPEITEVNLSNVFVNIFETVRLPDTIKLSIKIKDAEKVRTDPMLLQRAVTNLVINAIQAMPEGGSLEINGKTGDNRIIITVADTGVGIPEEVKPRLFTPMMTTKAKGQGFGLAVSKRIIETLKGTINFESEKGKGTKFIIELPVV